MIARKDHSLRAIVVAIFRYVTGYDSMSILQVDEWYDVA